MIFENAAEGLGHHLGIEMIAVQRTSAAAQSIVSATPGVFDKGRAAQRLHEAADFGRQPLADLRDRVRMIRTSFSSVGCSM